MRLPLLVFALLATCSATTAQPVIRSITIDRRDVFHATHDDYTLAGRVMNALHVLTKDYIIEDELLFEEGDDADPDRLLELERNLRRTGLFSAVEVVADTVDDDSVDVIVRTQDRFSLRPAVLFGLGGGIANVGAKVDEINLAGTATFAQVSALYRSENDIGWEGLAALGQRRLFRSEFGVLGSLLANRFRTDAALSFYKPYRTMATPWAMSVYGVNSFGRDFQYRGDTAIPLPFTQRSVESWLSLAKGEGGDRLFVTVLGEVNTTERGIATSRQAFDNTGRLLIAFSSISQRYRRTAFLDGFETEDVQTGGWGSAILGRIFAQGDSTSSMWYIGAQGERSAYVTEDIYLFGRIGGGSGIMPGRAAYTSVETQGLGHWRFSPSLLLAARFRQQTVWNWDAYHQLVLDNDAGLRGYQANALTGDNRVVTNVELRWMPGWKLWIFGLSGVVFHDAGAVWDQGTELTKVRMHHSVGTGVRIHNLKASGEDTTFRFDFAYNVDERRFGGLIFSVRQLFSAFGSHSFRPPAPFGADIDAR